MEFIHIQHLYRRAGFGISPQDAKGKVRFTREQVVDELFSNSERITPLQGDMSAYDEFFEENPDATFRDLKKLLTKTSDLKFDLNKAWLERICDPTETLNERMTLFWANVFVCKDYIAPRILQFNNTLRAHALGNFREFVKVISKEPAMMSYLSTNLNKKSRPNENFARELMELFTLGVDNYTEDDIKEAARAFTGYGYTLDGRFKLNHSQHDTGAKFFRGKTGTFNGDDIIDIICADRQCARFICGKLYVYFVNEHLNDERINELADIFYQTNEIKQVLKHLFTSDWFYEKENIGTKIKSPVDLLASVYRVVPFRFSGNREQVFIQRIMGQELMNPPNVAGWEGGRAWINTNSLMIRLKLASVLLGDGMIPTERSWDHKDRKTFGQHLKVSPNWNKFEEDFKLISSQELPEIILATAPNRGTEQLINERGNISKEDLCLQLMSLPEFQLT
ncbi:DUF1800 domain-containing protein [Constantimarinum furrinae]|uniref:DUF1800 domain-containing protein n=1 Tax=Constantimarinum furrinae TaxID=2562285 RepID=A0A7G8PV30_9FLAO|nr:DUF1800 domain-containing protein [Constantimarinum furrinae]QNJ98196.1 hypothetical protein ALE3EI_1644 [Constantimarinum furrinae]